VGILAELSVMLVVDLFQRRMVEPACCCPSEESEEEALVIGAIPSRLKLMSGRGKPKGGIRKRYLPVVLLVQKSSKKMALVSRH
jgi:hypothetical protein